jgi:ElaA protein
VDLTWHDLHQRDLTTRDLYDVLALRNRVFVVEQQCAYQDVDGLDLVGDNRHLLTRLADDIVGYARLLAPLDDGPSRIGRVIVGEQARGRKLGRRLMEAALVSCREHWPDAGVELAAQAHLRAFYASLGFAPISEVYDEDGIPHVDMRLSGEPG